MKKIYEYPEIKVVEFKRENIMSIDNPTSAQGTFYELEASKFSE